MDYISRYFRRQKNVCVWCSIFIIADTLSKILFTAAIDESLGSVLKPVGITKTAVILTRAPHPQAASTHTLLGNLSHRAKGFTDHWRHQDNTSVEASLQVSVWCDCMCSLYRRVLRWNSPMASASTPCPFEHTEHTGHTGLGTPPNK